MKKIFIFLLFICTFFTINAQSLLTDVNKADELYKSEQLAQALFIYKNIEAADDKINKRINEIEEKLKDATISNDQFQKCILGGNNALKNNEYEMAYICFNAALLIKPDANFPKTKLRDLSKHITDPNVDKRYNQYIAEADAYFNQQEYELAKKAYREALVVKPNDPYPSGKIVEIDELILKKNSVKKEYDDNIFYADRFFANGDLNQAKDYYQKALELLPNESYPKQKINDILKLQTDAAQLEESYNIAIANGDSTFNNQAYEQALTFFTEALTIKPNSEYPQTMINKINNLLLQINAKYNEIAALRTSIDEYTKAEQYIMAQSQIQKGLSLLPNDSLFISQKHFVDSIIAQQQVNETNFENFVSMASEAYSEKDYENAARYYSRALDIKHDEKIAEKKHIADSLYNLQIAKNQPVAQEQVAVKEEKKDEVAAPAQDVAANTEKPAENKNKKDETPATPASEEVAAATEQPTQTQQPVANAEDKAIQEEMQNRLLNANQSAMYDKMMSESILLFDKKLYHKALDSFKEILEIAPGDNKIQNYINNINTIFTNNVKTQLVTSPATITAGAKQFFDFEKILPKDKRNCYLKIMLYSIDEASPKAYINLYKMNAKKSGVVIKDIYTKDNSSAIYIRLSDIPVWMREDINRIEIISEGGGINIEEMTLIVIP